VLRAELGHLVGVPIDHYAAVNLPGFERVIDLVGGVTVNNPRGIDDPTLLWGTGQRGFRLDAGSTHLDGAEALAFVRSRKGPGDNDYTRARRQQLLLLALRERLASPGMLLALPEIIDAASELVTTDVEASELRDLVAFGRSAGNGEFTSVVLGPPYTHHPPLSETGGQWLLRLDLPRVAALSRELFGADSRYAE
jgi:anionic cell wall polymer biosynthesis LytR-Cps2A-Psr (LCP) family protein